MTNEYKLKSDIHCVHAEWIQSCNWQRWKCGL